MNVHASERIAGVLEDDGYIPATEEQAADKDVDLIIMNTCAVRENAAERMYGTIGLWADLKRTHPNMQIAIGGCMAQLDRKRIAQKAPWVDAVFGTKNIGSLPTSWTISPVSCRSPALRRCRAGYPSRSAATTRARSASCPPRVARSMTAVPATSLRRFADAWMKAPRRSRCSARMSTRSVTASATGMRSPSCCGPAETSRDWSVCVSRRLIRRRSPTT